MEKDVLTNQNEQIVRLNTLVTLLAFARKNSRIRGVNLQGFTSSGKASTAKKLDISRHITY